MTISIQYINTGTSANKGNGDTLRQAFMKINTNFATVSSSTLFDGAYSSLSGIPQDISVTANPTFSNLTLNGLHLTLANTSTSAAGANGAGIYVDGPATTATIKYVSADDSWDINKTVNVAALLVNGVAVTPASLGDIVVTDNVIGTVNTDEDIVLNPNGNGRVNLASSALQFDNGNDNIYRGHLLYTAPNSGLVGLGIDDVNTSLRIVGDSVTTGTLVDFGVYDNIGGTWTSKVYIDTAGVLYIGNQYPITKYPYNPVRITGDSPVYFASLIGQNINTGTTASTDFVLYNDQGTDLTNFIDIGINSSNYNAPEFSVNGAGDSYIFVANNNLTIGTAEPSSSLVFHAGGTTTNDAGGTLDQYSWTFNRRVRVLVNQPARLDFLVQNTSDNVEASAYFEARNDADQYSRFGINSSARTDGNILPGETFLYSSSDAGTLHIGNHSAINFYTNPAFGYAGTATLRLETITGNAILDGNLLPYETNTYNLGSTSSQWRSLYVGTSTIYLGGTALSVGGGTLTVDGNPVASGSSSLTTIAKTGEPAPGTGEVATVALNPTNNTNFVPGTYPGVFLSLNAGFSITLDVAVNGDLTASVISSGIGFSIGEQAILNGAAIAGGTTGVDDVAVNIATITNISVPTALDLTKQVQKLTNGWYTLADGQEGQVMHLVRQDAAASDQVTLTVAHGRVNGTVYPDILYTPFIFNSLPNDLITLIFTDGAWQSNNGAWD